MKKGEKEELNKKEKEKNPHDCENPKVQYILRPATLQSRFKDCISLCVHR